MSRGKPSAAQLDLAMGMMDVLRSDSDLKCEEGVDCRNYGVLDGIREAKQLLADMMEVPIDNVVIFGNSSLNIMYDTVAVSYTHLDVYKRQQENLTEMSGWKRRLRKQSSFGIWNLRTNTTC